MRPRTELHDILCAVLGSKNCYFQPPTGTQIKYPAIVYSFNGVKTKAADNKSYMKYGKYTITHCYKSPKESLVEILPEALPFVHLTQVIRLMGFITIRMIYLFKKVRKI